MEPKNKIKCPDCGCELEDISALFKNKVKIYRCNNPKCKGDTPFYDENLKHPRCEICGSLLWKIDHILPDIRVDIDNDGEDEWVCRNCAWRIMLNRSQKIR